MTATGLSDPVKLLLMLNAAEETWGIQPRKLPYYVLLLDREKIADFRYRFYWSSKTSRLECLGLKRDIDTLLDSELAKLSSPLKILPEGIDYLKRYVPSDRIEAIGERLSKSLDQLQKKDDTTLETEARNLLGVS